MAQTPSVRKGAQVGENARKNSSLNYKSAALSGEAAGPKVGNGERTRTDSLLFGTWERANFITAD